MASEDEIRTPTESELRTALEHAGYTVIPPPDTPPMRRCAICSVTEGETEFQRLVDVQVIVNSGEEGCSDVTRFYCDDCLLDHVAPRLLYIGLGSHRHGSTTLIEAEARRCGGYGVCRLYDEEALYTSEVY